MPVSCFQPWMGYNFPELNLDNDSGLPEADERSDSEETQEDTIVESLEIDARKGSPGYAYMSFRFCYHPSMEGNGAIISILPSLETKRYFFQHLQWNFPCYGPTIRQCGSGRNSCRSSYCLIKGQNMSYTVMKKICSSNNKNRNQ